jgi:hypothetical protein
VERARSPHACTCHAPTSGDDDGACRSLLFLFALRVTHTRSALHLHTLPQRYQRGCSSTHERQFAHAGLHHRRP